MGRTNGIADESAPINWSYDVGGDTNYLPACVTEAAYMINLANLKGHSYGMTLCGKNHYGSYINSNRMRPPVGANLHGFLAGAGMDEYSPLVDFMANEPTVTERNGTMAHNPAVENYLHEAGLVADAPSGTVYVERRIVIGTNSELF